MFRATKTYLIYGNSAACHENEPEVFGYVQK